MTYCQVHKAAARQYSIHARDTVRDSAGLHTSLMSYVTSQEIRNHTAQMKTWLSRQVLNAISYSHTKLMKLCMWCMHYQGSFILGYTSAPQPARDMSQPMQRHAASLPLFLGLQLCIPFIQMQWDGNVMQWCSGCVGMHRCIHRIAHAPVPVQLHTPDVPSLHLPP